MYLATLAESYLAHLEEVGKSRGTVFSYSMDLAIAVKHFGPDAPLAKITEGKVKRYFESDVVTKKKNGQAKAKPSVDKTRRVLRLALVWAAEQGLIPEAPIPQKEKAKASP